MPCLINTDFVSKRVLGGKQIVNHPPMIVGFTIFSQPDLEKFNKYRDKRNLFA